MTVSVSVEARVTSPTTYPGDGGRSRRAIPEEHLMEDDNVREEEEKKKEKDGHVKVGMLAYLHPNVFLPYPRKRAILR